jgi:hypothetical protein
MSSTSAAVRRASAASAPRPLVAPSPAPSRGRPAPAPQLTVVEPVPARLRRGPFVALIVTLLASGLLGLLLLNTVLAQDAFVIHDLERRTAVLSDREQALKEEVAIQESPERLARRAQGLGMVPLSSPAFIGPDGVLGVPAPATPAPGSPDDRVAQRADPAARGAAAVREQQ